MVWHKIDLKKNKTTRGINIIENTIDTVFFHSWFRNSLKCFYSENPKIQENIRLKEEQTLRVCKEILQLSKALDLNMNALRLAETIALFHDIDRFEQFRTYGTFNDKKSENNATLGLKVLEETNVLIQLTKTQSSIAYKAIGYHNVRKLPTQQMKNLIVYLERVYDTPNVGIISTCDELAQINDVNSLTLSAIVKQSGCSPFFIGTVSGDSGDIKQKLGEALEYDIILGKVGRCFCWEKRPYAAGGFWDGGYSLPRSQDAAWYANARW